jgi:hypothetical protein
LKIRWQYKHQKVTFKWADKNKQVSAEEEQWLFLSVMGRRGIDFYFFTPCGVYGMALWRLSFQ